MSNKIPFSFIEFQADTLHLSPCAVGIYIRLLCYTLQTKKHLPKDAGQLERIAGAHTDTEKAELQSVLQDLFTISLDSYVSPKIETILKSLYDKSNGARSAARVRWVNSATSKRRDDIPYQEIIDYLNTKTKPIRKPNSKGYIITDAVALDINKRVIEGHTLEDFKRAIDNKIAEWGNKPEFAIHLTPKTLFSDKMQNYTNTPATQSDNQAPVREEQLKRLTNAKERLQKELEECKDESRRRQLEAQIAGATYQINSMEGKRAGK